MTDAETPQNKPGWSPNFPKVEANFERASKDIYLSTKLEPRLLDTTAPPTKVTEHFLLFSQCMFCRVGPMHSGTPFEKRLHTCIIIVTALPFWLKSFLLVLR